MATTGAEGFIVEACIAEVFIEAGTIIGAVWPSFVDTDAPLLKVVPREEGHAPSRSRQCGRGGRAT